MGRGMPRPYSKSDPIVQRMLAANEARKLGKRRGCTVAACRDPISQVTFNFDNITAAMGRGMPRPYNKSNPIVQRMLAANEARKLGKRRGSTVAACRDPIIQVTFNIEKYYCCYESRHAATVQQERPNKPSHSQ